MTKDLDAAITAGLRPEGAGVFADLAYRFLLGRPAEGDARERIRDALSGRSTRHAMIREMVASAEFAEAALVEGLVNECVDAGKPFSVNAPLAPNTGERVIEIPWILSRYRGEERVLDIGYAYAPPTYLGGLLALPIPRLYGVDLSARVVGGIRGVAGDAMDLPFADASIGLAICISTLEHLGRDNSRYGAGGPTGTEGDLAAITEMARVLRPDGRMLVSVPVGRLEDHGWFLQYAMDTWSALIYRAPVVVEEQEIFRLTDEGWVRAAHPSEVADASYGDGCPAARAVLCASLVPRT